MPTSLESLDLTPDQLAMAREDVQKMAYGKWENAGRPDGDGSRFWTAAEREWIERCYVPARLPDLEIAPDMLRARSGAPREAVLAS